VQIQSGPAWVLDSGTVTTFGGNPLLLVLELPEDNFAVELRFSHEPEISSAEVRSEETGTGLLLQCVNFEPLAGRGSALPVLLGELGEDLVFLHFRAFRYGASPDWTVSFTFYRSHKDRVGWTSPGGSVGAG
jgi:hypothetical protein